MIAFILCGVMLCNCTGMCFNIFDKFAGPNLLFLLLFPCRSLAYFIQGHGQTGVTGLCSSPTGRGGRGTQCIHESFIPRISSAGEWTQACSREKTHHRGWESGTICSTFLKLAVYVEITTPAVCTLFRLAQDSNLQTIAQKQPKHQFCGAEHPVQVQLWLQQACILLHETSI